MTDKLFNNCVTIKKLFERGTIFEEVKSINRYEFTLKVMLMENFVNDVLALHGKNWELYYLKVKDFLMRPELKPVLKLMIKMCEIHDSLKENLNEYVAYRSDISLISYEKEAIDILTNLSK